MYGSKHRTTDGQYENRKDNSGYSSTKREWNIQSHETNEDSTSHRKYIRTQSSANNRIVSSSSQQQRQNGDKDKKTSKDTKKPLRIFGDWSEFKSSTGKTYFYNCKSEVSQWEKPKGWPTDDSSSSSRSTDRTKKDTTNINISPTNRSRHKMDESNHSNGDQHSHKSNHIQSTESSTTRLPSPTDESSRMSLSSTTSSKESSAVNNTSDRNGHSQIESNTIHPNSDNSIKLNEKDPITINGNDTRRSSNPSLITTEQTTENEPTTPSITKAERDQEMQKYYRADLIQHLTDWPANHYEKQCLKLFDEYYGYSAKMSTNFVELKALKSNFRVLEIKRSILTERLLRCQKHLKEREDDKLL